MIKLAFVILLGACSIIAGGIVTSKDSIRIYNNLVSSFADEIRLVNETGAAALLDSAHLYVDVMDTTGSGAFGGLDNRFYLQWKRTRPSRSDMWSLNPLAVDTYRLSPAASSSSIRPSLDFSAPGETLSIAFVEIGTCLGCSGVPTWYPPYFLGKLKLYYNNEQLVTIRLVSEDLRTPPMEDRPCYDYACDSLSVRRILDKNGMPSVPVSEVATVADGRIAGLELSYALDGAGGAIFLPKPITILPAEIGNLTALVSIMATGDTIDSISPRIGRCGKLATLLANRCGITQLPDSIVRCNRLRLVSLDGNLLTRLPDSIGKVSSLKHLSIKQNRLVTLPESMAKLDSMECVFISGNRICTLPPAVVTWLSNVRTQMHCQQYEPVWPDSQECTTSMVVQRNNGNTPFAPVVSWHATDNAASIDFCSGRGGSITEVVLYDLAGKTILRTGVSGKSSLRMSINRMARGVYTIVFFSGAGVAGVRQIFVNR